MFGWFKTKSPLTDNQRDWIDWRMNWLRKELGEESLRRPVITPHRDFFPDAYSPTRIGAETLFRRVCTYMGVDPSRVALRFYNRYGDGEVVRHGWSASGLFDQEESGRIVIWLEESDLSDAEGVVATCAHELAHLLLLTDRHFDREEPDHEHLTDLLTIYSGLGIFTVNSIRRDKSWIEGNLSMTSVQYSGYISMPEAAYALAVFAWLRDEVSPPWVSYIRANARADLKEELSQLRKRTRDRWRGSTNDERPPAMNDLAFTPNHVPPQEPPPPQSDSSSKNTDDPVSESEAELPDSLSDNFSAADEYFTRGAFHNVEGQYAEALEALNRAWELCPDDTEILVERALTHIALQNFPQAIEDATRRLQQNPRDATALRYRAAANLRLQNHAEILTDLDQILDPIPQDWMVRGLALWGLGDLRRAENHISRAINKDPHRSDSYLARSQLYAVLGQTERSKKDLREAIRRNPDYEDETVLKSALQDVCPVPK